MKKVLLVITFCFISVSYCFAQRPYSSKNFITETVDEFGDKTGEIKVGIQAKGYFSNSATSNSCADLILSFMTRGRGWGNLYEYCDSKSSNQDFHIQFIGTTSNEKWEMSMSNISYEFIELCQNNDTIKVKLTENSKGGVPTTAVFKLYNCKDFFQKHISQFGESQLITMRKSKNGNFLTIFSKSIREDANPYNFPGLQFNISYDYYGKSNPAAVSLTGYFENNQSMSSYGQLYIDGKQIPNVSKYFFDYQPDLNALLNVLHPNAEISIKHKDNPENAVSFTISEEQYNAVVEFYK